MQRTARWAAALCPSESPGYAFDGRIDTLSRLDHPADLGSVACRGAIDNVADLTSFPEAAFHLQMTADGPQHLRADVHCPRIADRQCRVRVEGETDLSSLAALVPSGIPALEPLRAPGAHGDVRFDATITYDPEHGLRLPQVNQSARDVAVGNTAMAGAGAQHG